MKHFFCLICIIIMLSCITACKNAQTETDDPAIMPESTVVSEPDALITADPTESASESEKPAITDISEYEPAEIPEEYSAFETILSVPVKWYSYNDLSANTELEEELVYLEPVENMEILHDSPEAFCITENGEIVIADTAGARLCVYDPASSQLIRSVQIGDILDAAPIRVTEKDGVCYVLIPDYNTRIVTVYPDGTVFETAVPQIENDLSCSIISEFYVENGNLILTLVGPGSIKTKAVSLADGSVTWLYSTICGLSNGVFFVSREGMKWTFPSEPSSGLRSPRIDILKVDEQSNLYVVQDVPVEGQEDYGLYQVFDKNGQLVSCDKINYFSDSYMSVEYGRIVGPDGNLYEMHCNEDNVTIMRLVDTD